MVNMRNYGAGIVTGLVSMSQGTCYWPNCTEPIVKFEDDRPVNNFEIAHIRAANKGGRRFVSGMTDEERNGFDNLVLLCLVHHKIVDKLQPDSYSIETLQQWKTDRETPGQAALRGLRGLTEERLQEMIAGSFDSVSTQINDALGRLEAIDLESANLLRPLVDQLAHSGIHERFPDEDVAYLLSQAAQKLANLEDFAPMLADAATRLANHADLANTLNNSATKLSRLEGMVAQLHDIADRIERLRGDM